MKREIRSKHDNLDLRHLTHLTLLSLVIPRLVLFAFPLYLLLTGLLAIYIHSKREEE